MRHLARCVGVLCILAMFLLAACDSPQEREAKYIESGKELFESGDYVKAALEFKNALQINPAGVDAQFYLGLIAEKQHNIPAAAAAFRKAADQGPRHFEAHRKAGQYALMGGDVEGAEHYAKDLIEIAPDKPDGHTMMAAVLLIRSKLPEAEKEVNEALRLDPNNIDALVILASRKARDQQFADAEGVIERGLKINPESTDLLLVKLKLLFDQKKTDELIAVLRQLHKIDPSNPSYVIDLATQLAAQQKLDEANKIYSEALEQNRDSDQLISAYASFLISTRSQDEAIEEIKALVSESKNSAKYVFLLEQLYIKAGKFDAAIALMTDMQKAGAIASDRLQAQTELARIAVLQGNTESGLDQLKAVFDQDPDNEAALLLRAAIQLNSGKYDQAIGDARSVLHHNIGSIPALMVLAKAYTANGDNVLAIEALRNLLQLSPNDVDARLQLATLLAAKSPEDALQNLDAAIALVPDAPQLKLQKAEYLLRTGKPDRAEIIGREMLEDPKLRGFGHRIIGESALVRSDFETAISELTQAQATGDSFESLGRLLVTALVKAGKSADAEALLKERIAANPQDSDSLILMAAMKADARSFDESEDLLRRAIVAKPDKKDAYVNLVQLHTDRGNLEAAIKVADQALAQFPEDHSIMLVSAVTHDAADQFEIAKAGYEKILAKWPSDMVAANNLAALIADAWPQDSDLLARARLLAEKFRNSGDPILLDTLGWVLLRQKNYDDATILLEKATTLAPNNQQLQFHYASALQAKGLNEKAKLVFAKALAGTPAYRGLNEARQQAALQ